MNITFVAALQRALHEKGLLDYRHFPEGNAVFHHGTEGSMQAAEMIRSGEHVADHVVFLPSSEELRRGERLHG